MQKSIKSQFEPLKSHFRVGVGILLLLILFPGCQSMVVQRDDPLIGKIYSTKTRQQISFQALIEKIKAADIIYLGENHNNADHHRHQLELIDELVKAGKKPTIGFEFFSIDQTGTLMNFVSSPFIDDKERIEKEESRLRSSLGWHTRSDETWQFYYQFVHFARKNKLKVFGSDLPAGLIRRINRNGIEQLTPVERNQVYSSNFEDDSYRQLMYGKLKDAHCGHSHPKMLERMYETWLARNDTMAQSITMTHQENPNIPVVMILGKGHVEHNFGIFERVQHQIKDIKQLNLGFQEISINPSPVSVYLEGVESAGRLFPPSHEYLWFTQRSSYEDPCIRFKKVLERMKKAHGKQK